MSTKQHNDASLAAIAHDASLEEGARLDAAAAISDPALRRDLLLAVIQGPLPVASDDPHERMMAQFRRQLAVEREDHPTVALRLNEAFAQNPHHDLSGRLKADSEAVRLGGTSRARAICEAELQNFSRLDTADREAVCGILHNGHRWRYNGITKFFHHWERHYEEYRCVLCGETATGHDPRESQSRPAPCEEIDRATLAALASLREVSGDKALCALLETERNGAVIRNIIATIAGTETLLSLARGNAHPVTRKEALLEAWERDHGVLRRIDGEELLCVLGLHVTEAADLHHIVERVENQECLFEIGKRARFRHTDVALAALAKINDQTMLCSLFDSNGNEDFFLPLLNMIRDRRALGHIALDRHDLEDLTYRRLAWKKIADMSLVFTSPQSGSANTASVLAGLAEEPGLLEELVLRSCKSTYCRFVHFGAKDLSLLFEALPEGSEAARCLCERLHPSQRAYLEQGLSPERGSG